MAKKRNKHSSNHTNKKYIEWIGIISGILAIILGGISIYEKSWVIAVLTAILLLLAASIYFAVSWHKKILKKFKETSEKEKKSLKKDLQRKENEIRKLRKETCKSCKTVYFNGADDSISFSENFDKYAFSSPYYEGDDNSYMVDYNRIYYLEDYFFITFHDEDSEGKCYLINLINGLIYLPIDNNEWKKVLGDEIILYRQLCSRRTDHLGLDQLL